MKDNPFPQSIRKVAIIAPAGPPDKEKLFRGVQLLTNLGLEVVVMPHVFAADSSPYLSASVEKRLSDLHTAWSDDSVNLILCARGGFGSVMLLDHINWELLRSRDVPFLGYSDITALQLAMIRECVTKPISAPMGCDITDALTHPFTRTSLGHSLSESIATLEVKNISYQSHTPIQSPALAANLTVLTSLIGTAYIPDLSGTILLIEDVGEDIYKLDRALCQLRLSGLADKCQAIVFGYFKDCGTLAELDQLSKKFAGTCDVPVFCNARFGHTSETICITQGREYSLSF